MKQILQNLDSGETYLEDVPCPTVRPGHVLIRTRKTLLSVGTERQLLEFSRANYVGKALNQPDRVKLVREKIKTDGIQPTYEAIRAKLDKSMPVGYCNVGTVLEVGEGVTEFAVGDRVASNGRHAEVVCVAKNLCAKVPDGVDDDSAAFTPIGAIALNGVRLLQPTMGECFVVLGLGLIGLVSVQLLRANGCRVFGYDPDPEKLKIAQELGADVIGGEDPVPASIEFSRGRGVDGVLIAAASKDRGPIDDATKMCRKRGRIVLVGDASIEIDRTAFFNKELQFHVSCSLGPGRYDRDYEVKGRDYPPAYVRWTEQRNMEAYLDLVADNAVDVHKVIKNRFPLSQMLQAYDRILDKKSPLGIILEYASSDEIPDKDLVKNSVSFGLVTSRPINKPVINFIGAGNYATRTLIPAFKLAKVHLKNIASLSGVSGVHAGKKFGFERTSTDVAELLEDKDAHVIVIATEHDTHADLLCKALRTGKHVFLEKPVAITYQELAEVEKTYLEARSQWHGQVVMVGFNRRFSPQVQKIRQLLDGLRSPRAFVMTVNSGVAGADSWVSDTETSGGQIIGEACHFIDLLRFLADSEVIDTQVTGLRSADRSNVSLDTVTFSLAFANGSIGTVHYLTNGSRAYPKERLEVFCGGRILQIFNFRRLEGYGWPHFRRMNHWRQNKGAQEAIHAFVDAVKQGKPSPIPFKEIIEVTRLSLDISKQLKDV